MLTGSLSRMSGILLRHAAVYRFNKMRWQDFLFWPLVELLLWGFIASYLKDLTATTIIAAAVLGALLLWQIFLRTQQGIGVSFLMELWSRNLMNVFVSPISVGEYLFALMLFGLVRILLLTGIIWVITILAYHVNVFTIGVALVPLGTALVLFGWATGTFVTGVVLRYGQSAESLAFALGFFFQPFGAVFFPVSVYPEWLQRILWWIPLPHIFENMRRVYAGQPLDVPSLLWAYALTGVYLAASFVFFGSMFARARAKGFLMKIQE